jgi:hypothetical protein
MTTEVNIPDEAMNRAREVFVRGRTGRSGVVAAVEAAAPLILAADINEDAGLDVLHAMATRVEAHELDPLALVGAVLQYADDRFRRASELRGEGHS